MAVRLDTSVAPPPRRLALWQDIVCDVFVELDCKSDLEDFRGEVTQSRLGEISYTRVDSSRQRVFRTPSRIARARHDYVLIALGVQGGGGVVQDGREAYIQPGEFACYDTTRPYELSFDGDFSQTILQIPRHLLRQRLGSTDALTATTFTQTSPLQRLAFDFMIGLSRAVDVVDASTADRLSIQALDLLALALGERARGDAVNPSTHRSALLSRLKVYIHANLRDPELSPTRAAAALGVSTRYVNALLSDDNVSFGRYVLVNRLDNCRRDLADLSRARMQIGEIAFAWGFNDLSHFSRAFHAQFGFSARECREQAAASTPSMSDRRLTK
jgi:AraC-like DNA-binding protein